MRTRGLLVILYCLSAALAFAQTTKPNARIFGDGLKAEYFAGPNFERKVLTRIDPSVSFNWNWQYPGPGVPREYFSVRWTGKLYAPTTGVYSFSAFVDDGIRVWVGGRKVIDEWRKQDDSEFVGRIKLEKGKFYDLRVEYYNDWKGSIVSLYWETPTDRNPVVSPGDRLYGRFHQTIPTQYLFSSSAKLPKPTPKPVAKTVSKPQSKATVMPTALAAAPPASGRTKRAVEPVAARPMVREEVNMQPTVFTKIDPGTTLILRQVLFEQSSYQLLPSSYDELNKLVRTLEKHPALRIEISGHTDNVGDPRLNRLLSENRANVVVNYLANHGVDRDRLEARGYGSARPLAGNETEADRARNRRVEFTVK